MNKLELFKTAFSPMYDTYVKITKIRYDDNNRPIIHADVNGQDIMFRKEELTQFCL